MGAQVVAALQNVSSRQIDPLDPCVISVTRFHAGTTAYNVIPDEAVLAGTLRSFSPETRDRLREAVSSIPAQVSASMGAGLPKRCCGGGAADETVR